MSRCDRCGCVVLESGGFAPLCAGCLLKTAFERSSSECAGDSFGDYEIICEIGEGGMGLVYLAEQNGAVHREVALKALKAGVDTAAVLRRFEAERQALALMAHPNIATLYDAGASSRGRPYFVMEFVDGSPITTACDQRACTIRERLALFSEVCRAIEHAHRKGIVHRDIKPSNILVTERDSRLIPKVIDFGISRALTGHLSGHTVATVFGELLGTPEYMSPEQAAFNSQGIGPASDIYSLGVLLYELLAGVLPFDPTRLRECGVTEATRIIREEEPPSPATRLSQTGSISAIAERRHTTPETLRRLLSRDLARVLRTCLQKEPSLRYPSATALADDVDRYLRGEPVLAQGPTTGYVTRKWLKRHRNWLGSLAVAAIAAGLTLWFSKKPPRADTPPTIRPLTSYTGTQLHPSFSPDGHRFAFVWDGGIGKFDVYVKQIEGGSPVRLTSDADLNLFPSWSPDGRTLAYIRVSGREKSLYVVPSTGGQARRVASLNTQELAETGDMVLGYRQPGPGWSPDGKTIVVTDSRGQPGPDALYEYRLDGGAFRRLTQPNPESAGDFLPAFSLDGRRLAFVRNGSSRGNSSLYLLDLKNGKLARILSEERGISGLAWMSNKELLFSSNRSGRNMLWHVSSRGGTPVPILGAGRGMNIISYLPSLGRVAFAEQNSNTNVWRVRLGVARPAPEKLLFSSRNTESAEYSPDGSSIVFVSNRLGTRQIWSAKADGTDSVQLSYVAPEVPIGTPRWSPDGRELVYDTVHNGHSAIGIMNKNGTGAYIFASDPWDDMMPSWSHDGERIYFTCRKNGELQVCQKPLAGGTTVIASDGGSDPRESPDGRFVFYARTRGIWQVTRGSDKGTPIPTLSDAVTGRYWTVAGNAIYFLRTTSPPFVVYRYDLGTAKISQTATLEKEPDFGSPGLAVSPDLDYLLFGQVDEEGSNIVMVEGISPD